MYGLPVGKNLDFLVNAALQDVCYAEYVTGLTFLNPNRKWIFSVWGKVEVQISDEKFLTDAGIKSERLDGLVGLALRSVKLDEYGLRLNFESGASVLIVVEQDYEYCSIESGEDRYFF